MSNRIFERFVECPGVIEIRWVSDDPDHHKKSEDMYLCQNNGIPEDYGKKDKRTTEQAHFYCCVCECQSASLKTLRAHCEGTQHKRKAEQFYQQYQHKQRKKNSHNESLSPDDSTRSIGGTQALYLCQLRRSTSVVGLQYVEEYKSFEKDEPPLYLCTLRNCKENNCEFNGEAAVMFEHLNSEKHGWSYFHRLYGNDFIQDDYNYEEVKSRVIKEESDLYLREVRLKPNQKDYITVRNNSRPDSSYIREAIELEKEKSKPTKPLPPKKQKQSSPDISQEANGCNGTCIAESNIKPEPTSNININGSGQKRRLSTEELSETPYVSKSLRTLTSDNPLFVLPPSLKVDPKPDLSLIDQSERSSKQSTANDISTNGGLVQANPQQVPAVQDPTKKFKIDVANWVMHCMNNYYQYPNNRQSCIRKILDPTEYSTMAKDFSKRFRTSEMESYLQVYRTFDGLEINPDMKDRIKMNIDMEFENKPLLPLE